MTRLLLDERAAPITSEIGFLEAPVETVAQAWSQWQQSILAPLGTTLNARPMSGTLAEVLAALEPLTSVDRRRFVFVPTAGRWTAFFDNGHQGTDAMPPMSYLAKALGCHGLRVVAIPDGPQSGLDERFGAAILEIYGPQDTDFLNYMRSLACINDGAGWTFTEAGTPQPWEDPDLYRKRLKKDRFTLDTLRTYLEALGVMAFEEGFYRPSDGAVLFEKRGPVPPGLQEFDLRRARRR